MYLSKLKMMVGVALVVGILVSARADEKTGTDKVPEGLRGFSGTLVGKVVGRDPEKGSLVLEVRQVKNVWKTNKATDPKTAVGKTLLIDGVFGKFIDQLITLKPGDGAHIETKHVKGDNLTFLGEELKKVPLPAAEEKK